MKRKLFVGIVSILVMISLSCSGQISVGAKAGINFNSFRKSESYRNYFDVVPGFNAGAFARYPVLSFLTARAELLYMQQGANIIDYRVVPELSRRNVKARFHNIQVPILVELGLPSLKDDLLQPKLLLGGFYSYTIASRESFTNHAKISGRSEISYDGYNDLKSQFESSQYGLIGAIAADVTVFNKPVSLEFRYQYNLGRANKAGTQADYNLAATHEEWGDKLLLHTLSINVAVTLASF